MRTDAELAREALAHLDILRAHLSRGDYSDVLISDAVNMRLAAAIEVIDRTTDDFRQRAFGDRWKDIWSTRNRIAHGYAAVDGEILRATIDNDLPAFEDALRSLLG